MDTDDFDDLPFLPTAVEMYLAQERRWWRMLRATGAMNGTESVAELARWFD